MTTTPDPLVLLRQYTTQHKSLELLDNDGNPTKDLQKTATVRFGEDATFERDMPTSYSRGNNEADQYTLSALIHFLEHQHQTFYEYMKTTNTLGIQTVSFGDRINLLNYLTGKTPDKAPSATATSAATGAAAAASSSLSAAEPSTIPGDSAHGVKRTADAGAPNDGSSKRTRARANDGSMAAADLGRDIMRRERTIVTSSSALSSNKSFTRVPELIKEMFPSKKPGAKPSGTIKPGSQTANGGAHRSSRTHRKRKDPIIVVPAATTAMLNMYNIKQFVDDHKFVDSKDVMARGGPKPREVVVERKLSGTDQSLKFRIVDSVQDFGEADWNSIVCVFTQGAAWQFKNWVWKSPEEVFRNCLGYYPKYHDERPKDATRAWSVQMLNIERSKRHADKATVVGLWGSIEKYIQIHKPEFLA